MSTLSLKFKTSKSEIIKELRNSGCKLLQFRSQANSLDDPIIIPGDAIKASSGAVARIVSVFLKNGYCELPTHAIGDGLGFGGHRLT
jgi:hypothetical protein